MNTQLTPPSVSTEKGSLQFSPPHPPQSVRAQRRISCTLTNMKLGLIYLVVASFITTGTALFQSPPNVQGGCPATKGTKQLAGKEWNPFLPLCESPCNQTLVGSYTSSVWSAPCYFGTSPNGSEFELWEIDVYRTTCQHGKMHYDCQSKMASPYTCALHRSYTCPSSTCAPVY